MSSPFSYTKINSLPNTFNGGGGGARRNWAGSKMALIVKRMHQNLEMHGRHELWLRSSFFVATMLLSCDQRLRTPCLDSSQGWCIIGIDEAMIFGARF